MSDTPTFIKVREVGKTRWAFLGSGGRTTSLRIHAVRFASKDRAQAIIDENAPDNPEWEWKTVSAAA